jgi:hypothetical protein
MTGVAVPSGQRSPHETPADTHARPVLDWQRLSDCSFIGLFLVYFFCATMCPVLQVFSGRLASVSLVTASCNQPVRGRPISISPNDDEVITDDVRSPRSTLIALPDVTRTTRLLMA